VAKTHIYWTHAAQDYAIRKSKIDGSGIETVIGREAPNNIIDLDVDETNGHIYYAELSSGIRRVDLDGSNDTLLISDANSWGGIALDLTNGHIYYSKKTGHIQRTDLDGSNSTNIITQILEEHHCIALDLTNGKVYWTRDDIPGIARADLAGTNEEDLVIADIVNPKGIKLDVAGGKMYWADMSASLIKRADLDGTNAETILDLTAARATLASEALALDLEAGKIYFGVFETDNTRKMQKANLDGSSIETVWDEDAPLGSINGIFLATEDSDTSTSRWSPNVYVRGAGSSFGLRSRSSG
jgi:hypothetical protein